MKETEKLAVAGRIAAGIAHEIRNPLTTVRGYLQLLKSDLPDRIASLVERLLIPELDRANDIITEFFEYRQAGGRQNGDVQLAPLFARRCRRPIAKRSAIA
ncbi:hypothetical protein DI43_07405 [Geobacillus sp. CAMR12739]|nr:hypothetical protein DI43_07405 [Geobacillus sp. CAMR12739]